MAEKQYKIILVEDDKNIARLIKYNLEKSGYEVQHAINGAVGIELVRSFKPDLIVSDIMMPIVNGHTFRKMLLAEKEFASIPFVFLTAKGEESDILEGYELEIQEYIIKSSSPKVILAKIQSLLKSNEAIKTRGESEIKKAAASMGAKVVPDKVPKIDGFEITQFHKPFDDIPGGDFLDYVKVNDDSWVIVVGDIMGKKWGAWYFAVAYAGYVRSAIRFALSDDKVITAKEIMQRVNNSVYEDERISDIFVTLSIVMINTRNNKLNYCGAGDIPLLHLSNGEVNLIKSDGTLLGFQKDGNYKDIYVSLKPDDEIFVLTDGIIESRDTRGNFIDTERLTNIIKAKGDINSIKFIEESVKELTNDKFEDDTTIISIKKL